MISIYKAPAASLLLFLIGDLLLLALKDKPIMGFNIVWAGTLKVRYTQQSCIYAATVTNKLKIAPSPSLYASYAKKAI